MDKKKDENIIIDYKSWTIPTSWDDVKLSVFQKLEEEKANENTQMIDILHILTNKTKDEVMSLPVEFIDLLLQKLSFMLEPMPSQEPTNKIEIDGETYQINFMEKLRVGEYVAVEMARKNDEHNYANVLAILCRKEGEIYDSTFENEVLPSRIELFENQPITKIMPLINFFLARYILLQAPSQLSIKIKEGINLERENIQNLYKNGEVSKHTMRSVMKTLKKLEKTINGI